MDAARSGPLRLRLHYAKLALLRYTGHLDMQRLWERTLRRASLPLAYTQGFHPQPRLHQACALPLGFTSRAELVEIWLECSLPLVEIAASIQQAVPPGIEILHLEAVDPGKPSIQTQVLSAEYQVTLLEAPPGTELEARITGLLAADALPRQRRGKEYNLRPLVERLALLPLPSSEGYPQLNMLLSAQEAATGRPEEVLDALCLSPLKARVERTGLILKNGMWS